jgi:hypothetical protein
MSFLLSLAPHLSILPVVGKLPSDMVGFHATRKRNPGARQCYDSAARSTPPIVSRTKQDERYGAGSLIRVSVALPRIQTVSAAVRFMTVVGPHFMSSVHVSELST